MNKAIIIGRATKDAETRYSNEKAISRFTMAVDRIGEGADFITCVAFGKTGEFAEKYVKKGVKFAIEGRILTGSYQKEDGTKVYTTDVVAERMEFVEKKAENSTPSDNGFLNVIDDGELPFN